MSSGSFLINFKSSFVLVLGSKVDTLDFANGDVKFSSRLSSCFSPCDVIYNVHDNYS